MKLLSVVGVVLFTLSTAAGLGVYDYDKVLEMSLLFYEAQRSGHLPLDNRIPWRRDSALNDTSLEGDDLTGGYYDAGDFVKFGFTMASTTTILSWGLLSYKDAYETSGQYKNCLNALKWATDYFIKCHVSPYELYGQIGDFALEYEYWGRPEDLNISRPAYKIDRDHPGTDLAGETAAALAAVSLAFKDVDPEYSALCLKHAKQLYAFANNYKGLYHEAIKGAAGFYESTGYADELTWSAAWLYKATNDPMFLDEAEHHYMKYRLKERPNEFSYNKKEAGVQILLAQLTGKPDYKDSAKSFCDFIVDQQKVTPKGLVYIDKLGTLCHASNLAFVCLQAADLDLKSSDKYRKFAKRQVGYMLGDSGRSYLVGFGKNYPKRPHHAASSCPDPPAPCGWDAYTQPGPNPKILHGALVSGPDENDFFEDKRQEYVYTEVTLDCNAGFQSTIAGLRLLELIQEKEKETGSGVSRRPPHAS